MGFDSTGGTIERELFGVAEIQEKPKSLDRIGRYEAMRIIKKLQPWPNPKEPGTDFTREVLRQYQALNPGTPERLGFFTAVGSVLDRMGVDGWFEGDDGRVVTVDLTTNPKKGTTTADCTWPVPPGGLDRAIDEQQFLGHSKAMAMRIGQLLSSNSREVRY